MKRDIFKIDKKIIKSRLIVGTGKYKNLDETAKAIKSSGADMVTVAVRRVNISDKKKPLLMDYINPKKIVYLPNTAGFFNSKDALWTLSIAWVIGGLKMVKLEILGDKAIGISLSSNNNLKKVEIDSSFPKYILQKSRNL